MSWEQDPEINRAFADLNKRRDASAKRRAAQIAERLPLLEKAKEQFERDLLRSKGLEGGAGVMARQAIETRYANAVAEIDGTAQMRREADARYRKIHGHNPDPEYAQREFSSATPGGMGSASGAIRDHITELGSEAAQLSKQKSSQPAIPTFNFDFRSLPVYDRKATVAGKSVERKSVSLGLKATVVDEPKGICETIFAVSGNLDRVDDVIRAGAFQKTIQRINSGQAAYPIFVWGHNTDSLSHVLGRVVDLTELMPSDPRLPAKFLANGWGGVLARVQFNQKTQSGRDALEHVIAQDTPSWSFAYTVADYEIVAGKGSEPSYRLIKQMDELLDVSLVGIPANPEAMTVSVAGMKSGVNELRQDKIQQAVLEQLASVFSAWRMTRR